MTDEERFWSRVQKTEDCWLWRGYGYVSLRNRMWGVHRFAWTLTYGAIPSGLFVCHHCDNASCVHPGHLFLATNQENMHDCAKKGRTSGVKRGGDRNPNAKLTWMMVRELRRLESRQDAIRLGEQYGVHWGTVDKVRYGQAWAEPVKEK